MDKVCIAYHSGYDGCAYLITNPLNESVNCLSLPMGKNGSLVGYGNPCNCPNYQKDNPGQGTMPMKKVVIPTELAIKLIKQQQKIEKEEELSKANPIILNFAPSKEGHNLAPLVKELETLKEEIKKLKTR